MAILENKLGNTYNTETGEKTTANTITADSLNNKEKPLVLPPKTPMTGYDSLGGAIDANLAGYKENRKAEQDLRAKELESGKSEISDLMLSIGQPGVVREKLYKEQGVDEARKQADDYTSQIEAEALSSRRRVEDILKNNPTGALRGGQADLIKNIERESISKRADLAILQAAATRKYDTAVSIADRQLEAKLEPLKANLESLKFFYQSNKADFDKEDDRLYNEAIKKADAELKKTETLETDIKNIKIEAAKNGASASVLGKLSTAKTLDEALKASGDFLMSPSEKAKLKELNGNSTNNMMSLLMAKDFLGGTTSDPVGDIVLASAQYGDKRLTDSQLEKIQKAQQALGSMESLQGLFNTGGVDLTGPVKGRVRTLVSQLGGDANAKAINATIQGLIPTVARGIFGEVGVLTDADIENYKKTVPNLTSSGDQNKLVSIIMYDVLSRSLENTLMTNAQNQTNVSNFYPTLKNTKDRIGALKSGLGYVETVPIDPKNEAKLEAGWEDAFGADKINNTLDSWIE